MYDIIVLPFKNSIGSLALDHMNGFASLLLLNVFLLILLEPSNVIPFNAWIKCPPTMLSLNSLPSNIFITEFAFADLIKSKATLFPSIICSIVGYCCIFKLSNDILCIK